MDADLWIRENFANLADANYKVTSPFTDEYNCIAWAAGDTTRWWWPAISPYAYWPDDLPRIETLQSFINAFQTLGYDLCENGSLEQGFEKVAIYIGINAKPTHMARQLGSGIWTSKLGEAWDIEHQSVQSIEGEFYGQAIQYLKRPTSLEKSDNR